MLYKCILGSIGHFVFFGFLALLILPGYITYLIAHLFTKEPEYAFQGGSAIAYKLFFFITPKIVLKKELRDDLPKSAIYVSTHQSILDFPALTTFIKKYHIFANINLGKYPIVANVCELAGVMYINGKGVDEVSKIYEKFEKKLEEGKNVIFFAEGTRHEGDTLLPFKRGAFNLSKKTSKPIVPVVIEGASKFLPRKAWCFRTSKKENIYLKVLEPLYPENFKSDKEMMEYAQKIMQKEKDRLCELG